MSASDDIHHHGLSIATDRAPILRCHPLELWRVTPFPDIGVESIREVRRALATGVCLHHRSWPAARRGEAAAAIAVTLDLTRGAAPDPAVADIALSAVLVAAWTGDAAARVVLAHVRAGLGCGSPTGSRPSRVEGRPSPRR